MRYAVALLIGALMLVGTAARAAELPSRIESLQGHADVKVQPTVIFPIAHAGALGLTEETITSFVIDRLNKAQVAASQYDLATAKSSVLAFGISIDLLKLPVSGDYVFAVQGNVTQIATLHASKRLSPVGTWHVMEFGYLPAGDGVMIRDAVEKVLDQFIKDWGTAQKLVPRGSKPQGDPFSKAAEEAKTLNRFIKDWEMAAKIAKEPDGMPVEQLRKWAALDFLWNWNEATDARPLIRENKAGVPNSKLEARAHQLMKEAARDF